MIVYRLIHTESLSIDQLTDDDQRYEHILQECVREDQEQWDLPHVLQEVPPACPDQREQQHVRECYRDPR